MIISNAKRWKLSAFNVKNERYCGLCKKSDLGYFVIDKGIIYSQVFICTRCMKQINRATSKYFRGDKK